MCRGKRWSRPVPAPTYLCTLVKALEEARQDMRKYCATPAMDHVDRLYLAMTCCRKPWLGLTRGEAFGAGL